MNVTCLVVAICVAQLGCSRSAMAVEICSGPDATLACAKQNFAKMYSQHYQRLWAILNEGAHAVHESASTARSCGTGSKVAEFLGLVTVGTGNAEFSEFVAEHIEQLCLEAPACFRQASNTLDTRTRNALTALLKHPVFSKADELRKAQCIEERGAK